MTSTQTPETTAKGAQGQKAALRSPNAADRKLVVALALFTAAAAGLFLGFRRDGLTSFRITAPSDAVQVPVLTLPAGVTGAVITVLLALVTVAAAVQARRPRRSGRSRALAGALFALLFLIGFLAWAGAGQTIPVTGLVIGAVGLSVPLIFGALGGVISERAGVINVAIEGQLLAGAFASAVVASATRNLFLGLLAAVAAGVLVSLVLGLFAITYWVDQVIVGVVVNVLVIGLTSFLFTTVLSRDTATLNSPARFPTIDIPLLSEIPLIGPALFSQTVIVYLVYIAVALVSYGMFRTRWGLRLRATGEHPQAADAVGIKVNRTRLWSVSLAGAITGLGGAYFTLGAVGAFQKEMTAGMGYIALAAVIFGRWDPFRATLAALLFGFATNLQYVLGVIGSPVPSELMLMLPYLVTIVAVAGLVGRVRGPAAAGIPYASR